MPEDVLTKNVGNSFEGVPTEAQEKMKEIITELHDVAFTREVDAKTNLISENIVGIVQIETDNRYMKHRFNIRNRVRDGLVEKKISTVRSRGGEGIKNLEGILKALKSEMNMMPAPPPSVADAMMGVRKQT